MNAKRHAGLIQRDSDGKVFSLRDESGMTLIEVVVATTILLVGLVAAIQAFPVGTSGMETGRRQTTGHFLAEHKIEEIRGWSQASGGGFTNIPICDPCTGAAPFNREDFNSIPGYAGYSRTVAVQNGPTANTRQVRVTVAYRRLTSAGLRDGSQVSLETLVAERTP
jgi:prepilin-type N-terminal cleavage/methylation domain-containing protein